MHYNSAVAHVSCFSGLTSFVISAGPYADDVTIQPQV